jgi:hypothetical protein
MTPTEEDRPCDFPLEMPMFCRRDWVRTNDPYRVKVVLYH